MTGEVLLIPVTNDPSAAEIYSLVVPFSLYDLIIGSPTMKNMRSLPDFDRSIATFRHESKVSKIAFITEGIESEASLQEEYTSEDSDGVSRKSLRARGYPAATRGRVKSLC